MPDLGYEPGYLTEDKKKLSMEDIIQKCDIEKWNIISIL